MSESQAILVVDDERDVRRVVVQYLRRDGFRPVEAGDGEAAKERFLAERPALVVLDVMLPKLDGLAVCRWLRERSQVPIIMLTARGEESDRIVGLEIGADDYLTKPFSPRELVARIKTVLRRAPVERSADAPIEVGPLRIDPPARDVTKHGERIHLTAKEFDLLYLLASHPRQVFSREQLMQTVWGYAPAMDTGTITVHMRRLREKVEDDPAAPEHLETVWGVGYRFMP